MNTGTPLWKDVFLSKDDTLKIAEGFIEALFPNPLEDRTDHLVRFYTDSHIRESIEVIFKFSESPIETIFLNALHFYSLLESPFFFMFAPPLVSANVQVSNYRSFYFRIKQMWEEYQQKSGEQSIEQFLASTLNRADLSREVKSMVESFAMLDMAGCHNSYFLSMQAKFEGLTIQGRTLRPDLLIWVPSRPQFKLVVECDGYAFHSDKAAYSSDRARDRLLRSHGFQVFRFSGHEIVNDPLNMANELFQFLVSEKKKG